MKKGYITYSEAFKMKVVEDDRARQICHDSAGESSPCRTTLRLPPSDWELLAAELEEARRER